LSFVFEQKAATKWRQPRRIVVVVVRLCVLVVAVGRREGERGAGDRLSAGIDFMNHFRAKTFRPKFSNHKKLELKII
jgi:hypothetical protein